MALTVEELIKFKKLTVRRDLLLEKVVLLLHKSVNAVLKGPLPPVLLLGTRASRWRHP